MKKLLNIDTWNRKDQFRFFNQFEEPFFGVTVQIDCTNAYRLSKEKEYSFFLYYLHASLKAANQIEPFRYRIDNEQVYLYDVHSEVSLELIRNAINITNENLVKVYVKDNAVLICPDKGASKKIKLYADWNQNLTDTVYCNKSRDLTNGKISLQVVEPEKCNNRNCVIIDDLCDGGGTFLAIAQQIQAAHLTLIVTHGVFSKGFTELEKVFDEIIVSDSYRNDYDSATVQMIPFEFAE